MRRIAIAVFLVLLAVTAVLPSAARAQSLFLDYVGYDYEDPNPDGSQFGELGSGYVGLGLVPGLFAPLVADTAQYEYTYYISGLTSVGATAVGQFLILDYTPGTLSVYEDAKTGGTPATFGVNPPNGTAPPSFTDGTLFVTGALSSFRYVYDTVAKSGSYEGNFDITGGQEVANGDIPANRRKGWTFAGVTANELNMPQGYAHQVDGQVFLNEPVRTQSTTWGGIKARYR